MKDLFWTPPCKSGDFDQGSRLSWEWGDTVLNSARISIQLRYKLLPYIYTMTRIAYEQGIPLCRGLYIDYPENHSAYRYDEFMFGDKLLSAPILHSSESSEYKIAKRTLWLPKGEWYDYFTQKNYRGNNEITIAKSLYEFPLFVKAGSILPIAPYQEYSGATMDSLIILAYSPAKSERNIFRLYEDDGESFLFQQNQYRWINLEYDYKIDQLQKIVIDKPEGSFKGEAAKRAYKIFIINTAKPKRLTIDGKEIDYSKGKNSGNSWSWDQESKVITVFVATRNIEDVVTIEAFL